MERIGKIFSNELVLRHLFTVVPLDDLKTFRLVCTNWRDLAEVEFKKRSVMEFDFNSSVSVRTLILEKKTKEEFSKVAVPYFNTLEEIEKSYSKLPRDSFFFKGPIWWRDAALLEFFRKYGGQIKYFRLEIEFDKISSVIDLLEWRQVIISHLPNLEHLSVTWPKVEHKKLYQMSEAEKWFHQKNVELAKALNVAMTRYPEMKEINKLKSLKTLELLMFDNRITGSKSIKNMSGWYRDFQSLNFENNLLDTFQNFISCCENLQNLYISDIFRFEEVNFNSGLIQNLKTMKLKISTTGNFPYILADLMKLSAQGLKLDFFSMDNMDSHDLSYLLQFLESQSRCLKFLKLEWDPSCWDMQHCPVSMPPILPPWDPSRLLRSHPPAPAAREFPTMECLEVFDLSFDAFGYYGSQVEKFPVLKTLRCRRREGNRWWRFTRPRDSFLGLHQFNFNRIGESVSSIIVYHSRKIDWVNYTPIPLNELSQYFCLMKWRLTNLSNIIIIDQDIENEIRKLALYFYGGNMSDSYFYMTSECLQ